METFEKNLTATQKSMTAALNNLDRTTASMRGLQHKLRDLEELDAPEAQTLLGDAFPTSEDEA